MDESRWMRALFAANGVVGLAISAWFILDPPELWALPARYLEIWGFLGIVGSGVSLSLAISFRDSS